MKLISGSVGRFMIVATVVAAAAGVSVLTAGSASAATPVTVGSGWHEFGFGPLGSHASGAPFTFTSASVATLTVTDAFNSGDQFALTDNGLVLGSTSTPTDGDDCSAQPDICLTNPNFSHGVFSLAPGAHSIDITVTRSATGFPDGGGAYLRVEGSPCTTVITGTHAALTVTSGTTCVTNATITGSISVARGATLSVTNSTVQGSISAYSPAGVTICGSDTGSVTVTAATGVVTIGDPSNNCAANTVAGSVLAANNHGGGTISGNTVAGTVTASGNIPPFTVTGNHH